MMSKIVRHDAFARAGLRRECVGKGECKWCGQKRNRLFTYEVETDGGSRPPIIQPRGAGRTFCNLECFDAFSV